jgi:hypothetical protein
MALRKFEARNAHSLIYGKFGSKSRSWVNRCIAPRYTNAASVAVLRVRA